MTSIVERYDRDAALYERYWQPVLDDAVRDLLGRLDPLVERRLRGGRGAGGGGGGSEAPTLLDLGTGTGALAVMARKRWPRMSVLGVDPSSGMLALARSRADSAGLGGRDGSLRWEVASAESLPLPDGSIDLAASSFVLQLVTDRTRTLREVARVLRPGGSFAFVTWLDRSGDLAPDREFDEAVYDLDLDDPEPEPEQSRAGDFRSIRGAERELRAAGFARLAVRRAWLEYRWTPTTYLEFKTAYDERELIDSLDASTVRRLLDRVRERWARLPAEAFTFRAELVSAVASVP